MRRHAGQATIGQPRRGGIRVSGGRPVGRDAVLELQRLAGNHAVSQALAVQRDKAANANDGGELDIAGYPVIPIQSAGFKLEAMIVSVESGKERVSDRHVGGLDFSPVEVTRAPDERSSVVNKLVNSIASDNPTPLKGSLRLSRPSKDGAVPAGSVDFGTIEPLEFGRGKGMERLSLGVDTAKLKGLADDKPKKGDDRLVVGGGKRFPAVAVGEFTRDREGLNVTIPFGPTSGEFLTSLLNGEQFRHSVTIETPSGPVAPIPEALVASVALTGARGANAVDVRFVDAHYKRPDPTAVD